MKFTGNWLRKFVDYQCSREELARQLTMAGLEVESVQPVAPFFDKVVTAEILSVQKHANADRLKVCEVNVGKHADVSLQIVCGAPNVAEGMKVVCALIGARLPELNIKRGKIRGVESFGMLCSAEELGLESEVDGLIELPHDAPVGIDFREYDELNDSVFTLALTPNRADCLGMFGVAREVAAITNNELNLPKIAPVSSEIPDVLQIDVKEPQACPLYCGRIIKGVTVSDVQIPKWMHQALVRAGLRAINPVVDITNYVMLETGQPMHAFDLAKLAEGGGARICVRYADEDERLSLLNGEVIDLRRNFLVIADSTKPLALAGIMGGDESGVVDTTTDIFLESAFFSPTVISGKSFTLGFGSDSSYRFERGVDFSMTRSVLERATALILDVCGGKAGPIVEACDHLPKREAVKVRPERVARILGVNLDIESIAAYFQRLQFSYSVTDGMFHVVPPAARFDLEIEEDFIEELARIHGYDLIPAQLPQASVHMLAEPEISIPPAERVRKILIAREYQEVINYTFVDARWEGDFVANDSPIKLKNPIANHMSVMRSSLLGGLINNLQFNLNRKQSRVRIFELGSCFLQKNGQEEEIENLAMLCSGSVYPEQWGIADRKIDFYDVKMDVESLLGLQDIEFQLAVHPALHPGKSAKIMLDGEVIGWIGELHPRWLSEYQLSQSAVLCELQINALARKSLPAMQTFSKFPSIRRDISVVVDSSVTAAELLKIMNLEKGNHVSEISLFDLYSGKNLESGKKSLAFRILLRGTEKNLTDQEIDKTISKLIDVVGREFGAILRN